MKQNIFILLIIFFAGFYPAKGQYSYEYQAATVKTPTGINVDALQFKYWLYNDFDEDDIAIENNDWTTGYNCEIIENSTKYYNCHGYAWHNVEGNSAQSQLRWINNIDDYYNTTYNVQKYYSSTYSGGNPSYKEVSINSSPNLKVSYFPRDHSALTDSETGYFVSKWAWGPLVKHLPAQCPFYPNSVIKYYTIIEPTISVSYPILCNASQQTVSESSFTDISLTYDWSTSSPLSEVSGDGTSSYTVAGTSPNGSGAINLTITTPSGATANSAKTVWVGTPQNSKVSAMVRQGPSADQLCMNTDMAIVAGHSEAALQGVTQFIWDFGDWAPYFQYYDISPGPQNAAPVFNLSAGAPSSQLIRIYALNSCGYNTQYYSRMFYAVNCGGYLMSVSPNPATDEATIELVNTTDAKAATVLEWELSIFSPGQVIKEKVQEIKDKTHRLNIQGWQEGVYIIRAIVNGEPVAGKLVVKH